MNLFQPFREQVMRVSVAISDTFDHIAAKAKSLWGVEHNPDGTHGTITDLTATTATIGTETVTTSTVTTATVTTETVTTLNVTGQITVTGGTLISPSSSSANGINIQLPFGGTGIPFVTTSDESNVLGYHSGYTGGGVAELLYTVLMLSAGGVIYQARNNANSGGTFRWKDAAGTTMVTLASTGAVTQIDTPDSVKGLTVIAAGASPSNLIDVIDSGAVQRFRIGASYNLAIKDSGGTDVFTVLSASGNVVSLGSILSTSATAGVGYTAGAGGTVTQITSKATGVTLNKVTGQITMNNAALASLTFVSFVVTNSAVAAVDVVAVSVISGGTANAYMAAVTAVAAGSFTITVQNITGGSLSEAPVIGFTIIKGATT